MLTWGDPAGGGDSRFIQMGLEGSSAHRAHRAGLMRGTLEEKVVDAVLKINLEGNESGNERTWKCDES